MKTTAKYRHIGLALVCAILCACSQKNAEPADNDWKIQELNGKVKSVSEISFNIKYNDTTSQDILFNEQGMITNRIFYSGDSIERQVVYNDSMRYEISSDGILQWIIYVTRNDKGQIEEEYTQSAAGEEWATHYNYNDNGQVVLETSLNTDSEMLSATQYSYNKKGLLETQTEVGSDGQIGMVIRNTYTKKGKPSDVMIYGSDDRLIQHQTYKYDSQGNEIEERYVNSEGMEFYVSQTEYKDNLPVKRVRRGTNIYDQLYIIINADGHKQSEIIYESENIDGEDVVILRTERLCDEFGNWIEEKVYEPVESDNPVLVTYRTICYY